jgi:hypothetical protein
MMKRYFFNINIIILFVLFFSACDKDFLDRNNPGAITSEDVWNDNKLITQYVNLIYNDRPGFESTPFVFGNITDEGCGGTREQIWRGELSEIYNPLAFWAYTPVRRANEFFARIDDTTIDKETKQTLKGEVRFLRAFLYFDMVKRYGGVPLITHPQTLDEDLEVPRNTLDECFNFIIDELDIAITELPATAVRGRADQGAAKALKGRALLYHASPLYNPNGDNARWKKAADANLELIGKQYELYPDLEKLWLDNANKESIFEVQYAMPMKMHGWDAAVKMMRTAIGDAGACTPFQELVDAFPMKNGKAIHEAGSGYDPTNPYVGRDDRFYAFIFYNGSIVRGYIGGMITEFMLETYVGGRDYPSDQGATVPTSYFVKKMVDQDNTIYRYNYGSTQSWLELRYAEVLLNYAEAQNEYLSAPDQSVCDAINLVRQRAGITELLVPGTLNKEQMRSLVQNERYIEFCFEQKRYWDLRRWKLAVEKLNGKKCTAAVILKNADGSFSYGTQPFDPQPGVFDEKMYFMPFPQTELSKNSRLEQNPGW